MTHKSNHKDSLRLELLGIGSAKHRAFKANLNQALEQLSVEIPVVEVQDIDELLQYDIAAIPALVCNGKVLFQENVPSVEDLVIVLKIMLHDQARTFPLDEILLPTDFSETAANAYRYGRALAAAVHARLHLIHVHQPLLELTKPYQFEVEPNGYSEKEQLMTSFTITDREAPGVPSEIRRILTGAPVEEIRKAALSEHIDLIVMGTTGAGGLLGRWFGSISSEVARRSGCPVLLVPRDSTFQPFRNIIYASGHQPSEEEVVPSVISFAQRFGAAVHFAHIRQLSAVARQPQPHPYGKMAAEAGVHFTLSDIDSHNVLDGLNWFAEEKKADLMVMSTTHRSFIEELFHKSMTRRMVFNTRIPLLVLRF